MDYNPKINAVTVDAFADQYRSFDKVLGVILKHFDENTYVFDISDHGIKAVRKFEEDPHITTAAPHQSSPSMILPTVTMCLEHSSSLDLESSVISVDGVPGERLRRRANLAAHLWRSIMDVGWRLHRFHKPRAHRPRFAGP